MKILVTNDDGIHSPGIRTLIETLSGMGTVIVAAPSEEKSAASHALTISRPLFVKQIRISGVAGFAVDGTPADCIKLAVDKLMPERPDVVVSGINQGANTGINVFYSGTVAAALEATLMGIPAVAVSLASHQAQSFLFSAAFTRSLLGSQCMKSLPAGVFINVNIPNLPEDEIKGIRITRQGEARYSDCYIQQHDPDGRPFYWLTGTRIQGTEELNMDVHAVRAGYISMTPLRANLNADWNSVDIVRWFAELPETLLADLACCRET